MVRAHPIDDNRRFPATLCPTVTAVFDPAAITVSRPVRAGALRADGHGGNGQTRVGLDRGGLDRGSRDRRGSDSGGHARGGHARGGRFTANPP